MSIQNGSLCTCGCCEQDEHLELPMLENSPGLPALKYRLSTQAGFRQFMISKFSQYPALDKLGSRNDDDHTIATVDAWATVLDVLSFYQERSINEGYLRTATERLSVLELARHINYRLQPGVAAAAFLAFSMSEAPGSSPQAILPAGTKVQSIPEQNELPQIFETSDDLEARVVWNGIKVQTLKKLIPVKDDKYIYLAGINTGLLIGDALLFIGDERLNDKTSERWDFRRIQTITTDTTANYTKITWNKGLGDDQYNISPASINFKVYALKQKASLFGYNAPEYRVLPPDVRKLFVPIGTVTLPDEWPDLTITKIAGAADTICLDNLYPKILKDSWVVVASSSYEEVYKVDDAEESARRNFSLASKSSVLKLNGENLADKFDTHVRDIVVYGQSEELAVAEVPVDTYLVNGNIVMLQDLMPDLPLGKTIIISGKRKRLQIVNPVNKKLPVVAFIVEDTGVLIRNLSPGDSLIITKIFTPVKGKQTVHLIDDAGIEGIVKVDDSEFSIVSSDADDVIISEVHMIDSLIANSNPTQIVLEEAVANWYDPLTVLIAGNVADSTHGETKVETLGSGNGSKVFQQFKLKQKPLTYTSAAAVNGVQTSLQIRVNNVLWTEVSSFFGAGPKDRIYTAFIEDDGTVTIRFGDGITGARLPTGVENVQATYRVGIGLVGILKAGQLSLLMTPQLGVNKVTNPLPSSGANDPELMDAARDNAPLTVLTLDRIVSPRDFEDFARAFAGIGKARADVIWIGERQVVYITIASSNNTPVDKLSDLYVNLVAAINGSGHSYNQVFVENYKLMSFTVDAGIQVDPLYIFEDVQQAVIDALIFSFSFETRSFGQSVTPAEIIAVIQGVAGVVYTDLQLLDGKDPVAKPGYRIIANIALLPKNTTTIRPAELLLIDEKNINITQIV